MLWQKEFEKLKLTCIVFLWDQLEEDMTGKLSFKNRKHEKWDIEIVCILNQYRIAFYDDMVTSEKERIELTAIIETIKRVWTHHPKNRLRLVTGAISLDVQGEHLLVDHQHYSTLSNPAFIEEKAVDIQLFYQELTSSDVENLTEMDRFLSGKTPYLLQAVFVAPGKEGELLVNKLTELGILEKEESVSKKYTLKHVASFKDDELKYSEERRKKLFGKLAAYGYRLGRKTIPV